MIRQEKNRHETQFPENDCEKQFLSVCIYKTYKIICQDLKIFYFSPNDRY